MDDEGSAAGQADTEAQKKPPPKNARMCGAEPRGKTRREDPAKLEVSIKRGGKKRNQPRFAVLQTTLSK